MHGVTLLREVSGRLRHQPRYAAPITPSSPSFRHSSLSGARWYSHGLRRRTVGSATGGPRRNYAFFRCEQAQRQRAVGTCAGLVSSEYDRKPDHRELSFGVKAISRQQWNVGFRSDSDPSRGNLGRRAFRPIATSKRAACYVCSTSKPVKLTRLILGRAQSDAPAVSPRGRRDKT
jgi:hypothetical protein